MAKLTRKQLSNRAKAAWRTRRLNAALDETRKIESINKELSKPWPGEAQSWPEEAQKKANAPAETSTLSFYEGELRSARADLEFARRQLAACEDRCNRAELELSLAAKSVLSEG